MDQSEQKTNGRDPWAIVSDLIENDGGLAQEPTKRNASKGGRPRKNKTSERERRALAAKARRERDDAEPGGRPRGRFKAGVPWEEIERAFVHGEPAEFTETGEVVREHAWPTYTALAERFPQVSRAMIYKRSRKHDWMGRREAFKQKLAAHIDEEVAKALALSTADAVGIVDQYLAQFRTAILDGRVRHDAFTDFDKAVRLKELLLGNADSRAENRHTLSLDELQAKHREKSAKRKALEDVDTGMLDDGAPSAVLDVEGIETKPTPEPAPALEANSAETP